MATSGPPSALIIREVSSPAECAAVSTLFTSIWGGHQHIPPELARAIVESGGYVVAARRGEEMVGGSVAVVGQSDGHVHLHSHITGVVPGEQGQGVGLALKRHQRDWARARGMPRIVWTFDPLVRRNAFFNLARLGARAIRYEVDFYGPVRDAINGDDETDRLVVEWSTSGHEGLGPVRASSSVTVATPPDIVLLRSTDPHAARAARLEVRSALGERMASGWTVVGIDEHGSYVLRPRP
ncbi:MAG TPA: GNAT family N-acetyltransferase [Acidimicrobiales bacterium]|nr:GNAT family N-acetyltransferase [Acidimicrobiales bacterium]